MQHAGHLLAGLTTAAFSRHHPNGKAEHHVLLQSGRRSLVEATAGLASVVEAAVVAVVAALVLGLAVVLGLALGGWLWHRGEVRAALTKGRAEVQARWEAADRLAKELGEKSRRLGFRYSARRGFGKRYRRETKRWNI
jgi:hypothetical protein